LIGEARTYVVKDNGDTAASGNLHDDRIMAYAIAEMLRRHEPARREIVSMHDDAPCAVRIAIVERQPAGEAAPAKALPGGGPIHRSNRSTSLWTAIG
jgi:hypothetical protein